MCGRIMPINETVFIPGAAIILIASFGKSSSRFLLDNMKDNKLYDRSCCCCPPPRQVIMFVCIYRSRVLHHAP